MFLHSNRKVTKTGHLQHTNIRCLGFIGRWTQDSCIPRTYYSKEEKHTNNTMVIIISKLDKMVRNIKQGQERHMKCIQRDVCTKDQGLEEGVPRSNCWQMHGEDKAFCRNSGAKWTGKILQPWLELRNLTKTKSFLATEVRTEAVAIPARTSLPNIFCCVAAVFSQNLALP